jgi:uncharacterized repeat protein (TIGR02543 family)
MRAIVLRALTVAALVFLTAVGAGAQTADNPREYLYENFTPTGTPTGWSYSGFGRQSSSGISNGACLQANIYSSNPTANVTTSYVAMGASPVLSFKYKANNWNSNTPAAANALQYTVSISTDGGTTWANVSGYTNVRHASSADYLTVTANLSAYANRTVRARITFAWVDGDINVWLDDVAVGTVPPIFACNTLEAGTVYNNYSSSMTANTRTHNIMNKGSRPLTISLASTTGGVAITGLPVTLSAFETRTISVIINATSFATGGAYNGSFTVSTNDPNSPTTTVSVTGTVRYAPETIIDNGGTAPTGWTYSGFGRNSSGGVDNSACLQVNIYNSNPTANVTTSYVAMGANPVLSFKYKANNYSSTTPAAANALQYTVSVSRDGTTWTNLLSNVGHISSTDYVTITPNLPAATYANQIVWARISFAWVTGDIHVYLDDFEMKSSGYTITYNANNGTVTPVFGTVVAGGGTLASLPTPTRAGYTFDGWFTSSSGGTEVTTSTVFNRNTTIYAQWTLITYTVMFDANGGTVTTESGITGVGGTLSSLPTPTRVGYVFEGWFTAITGGSAVTTSTTFSANATIYARWTPIYTVTFNANGGTVTSATATTGTGGKLASLPTPTRTGYTFVGWFTAETGGTAVTASRVYSENTTIYAQWTLITYTVTFNTNSGTVTPTSGTTGAGGTLASLPEPVRTNYIFVGWFTASTGGTEVTTSTVFTANTTIYARWIAIYIVTFNANSGVVTPTSDTTGTDGTLVSLPTPTRDGYTFNGWFTSTTGGTAVTESRVYSANATIYAQWTLITYTITFDATGGTITPESGTTGTGWRLASLPTPTRTGHAFDGWFTAETGGERVTTSAVFSADATIYARWTLVTYTVTFNASSGTVTPASGTTGEGWTLASLPEPTRSGYIFDGWFTASTGGTAVTTSTVFSANATIYARWTLITHTVTFNANSGTVTPESGTTGTGGKLTSLPMPVREGYAFDGWFTAEIGGEKVTTSTVFSADATIYARWTAITYTVTFNANGGTVTPASGGIGSGGTLASLPEPVRNGYAFDGWFTTATGGTAVTTSTVFSADATIYARWTSAYTVMFDFYGNGAITATVDGEAITTGALVRQGNSVVFTVIPDDDYIVSGWTLNGVTVAGNTTGTYTLTNVSADAMVTVSFTKTNSIASNDRVIPQTGNTEIAVVAPVSVLTGEFTAGPNPAGRSSGGVAFFWHGKQVKGGALTVYDAAGNVVRKLDVKDNAVIGNTAKRAVGLWDLKDAKGRPVSDGTYLVKGKIAASGGKAERVSAVVGVR